MAHDSNNLLTWTFPRIRRPVMNTQETANHILVDLDAESQRNLLSDAGTAQLGLRRFMPTTASMRALFGPLGPGRRPRSGETCGTFVSSAHCADAAEWKASERWRNGERVPGA